MKSPNESRYVPQHAKKKSLLDKGWKRAVFGAVAVLLCVALISSATFGVLWLVGRQSLLSGTGATQVPSMPDVEIDEDGSTVRYKGNTYTYNKNLTSALFIGTDRKDESDFGGVSGQNGQADALYLAVIDTSNGKTTVIAISRDIMTDVRLYSVRGEYVGVKKMQVCLSFAYGDGKEKSCESTVQTVSNLLYGIDINTYFCMDWENIATLNNIVGGVEVPEYDANWNPTGKQVTLKGDAVLDYILLRDKTDLNSSTNRLERQVNYLKAFSEKTIERTKQDISVPLNLYNALSKSSINTLDASKITYLTTVFMDGGAQLEFRTLTGKMVQGEEFAEMYLDDTKTYEMLLDVFYIKQ